MLQLVETDWAYLAGLVDGDGCFGWFWDNSTIFMTVQMTHEPTIDWLVQTFGGFKTSGAEREAWKTIYSWRVTAQWLRDHLHLLAPYLHTKAQQAAVLMEAMQLRSKRGPSSTRIQQFELYNQLRRLNRRGKPSGDLGQED